MLDDMAELLEDREPGHVLRDEADGDRWAWRARIRRNPGQLFWYRIGVGVLGLLMMVAAALTGWLPGPGGIPLFLLGLAVWASEFEWAHRLLSVFTRWFEKFKAMPTRWKQVITVVTIICILATWYAAAWYSGVPAWLPDPVENWLVTLPGLHRPA